MSTRATSTQRQAARQDANRTLRPGCTVIGKRAAATPWPPPTAPHRHRTTEGQACCRAGTADGEGSERQWAEGGWQDSRECGHCSVVISVERQQLRLDQQQAGAGRGSENTMSTGLHGGHTRATHMCSAATCAMPLSQALAARRSCFFAERTSASSAHDSACAGSSARAFLARASAASSSRMSALMHAKWNTTPALFGADAYACSRQRPDQDGTKSVSGRTQGKPARTRRSASSAFFCSDLRWLYVGTEVTESTTRANQSSDTEQS